VPAVLLCALSVSAAAAVLDAVDTGHGTVASIAGTKVPLTLDEYRIAPADVRVHAGRIKIVARNVGVLTHNVKVESERVDTHGSPIILGGTTTAQPGQTVSVKIDLAPGRYKLVCTLADHANLGQRGTLTVR